MITFNKSNKKLLYNILIFLTYFIISYFTDLPLAIFCAIHSFLIFTELRKIVDKILPIRDMSNAISVFVLIQSVNLWLGSVYMLTQNHNLFIVIMIYRFVINSLILIVIFVFLVKYLRLKYSILIVLEFLLLISVFAVLYKKMLIPVYEVTNNFDFLSNLYYFMTILDYFLIFTCLSFAFMIFKYQQRYLIGITYPLMLGIFSITYIMPNIYLVNMDYFMYNTFIAIYMLVLFVYRYKNESFINNPIAEIMNDADTDYRIETLKNARLVHLIFMLVNFIFVLFIFKIISIEVYKYMAFTMLIYILVTLQANKVIVNKLLLKKAKESNQKMKSIIEKRNVELLRANAKLAYLATHDKFTKLPNRFSFISEVGEIIEHDESSFSFILINIINLKEFRNIYGSDYALDLFLQFIKRLRTFLDEDDYIYQISNNELALISLAKAKDGKENYYDFFNYFYNALEDLADLNYKVADIVYYLKLKISFVRFPEDVSSLKELFIVSDLMSFTYKKDSRFIKDIKGAENLLNSLRIKNKYSTMLKEADYDKEFSLYYQPQFDINTKEVIACEALIRWQKDGEFISPGIFIPIAESIGLIYKISLWVAKEAIKQMEIWRKTIGKDFKIAINVSPLILDSQNFFNEFKNRLALHDVEFTNFDFEITEHSEFINSAESLLVLNDINSRGVSISIDDFGTGYSSLAYVRMYSVGKIKIAKELVDEIAIDEDSRYMVEGIINMAKTLGMDTIAEGVEDEKQLSILRELNCDKLQGYIWGKPVPKDDFEKMYINQAK